MPSSKTPGSRSRGRQTRKKAKRKGPPEEKRPAGELAPLLNVINIGDALADRARLRSASWRIKSMLLATARVEPGRLTAELRLLPGRKPTSTDPEDYDLVISQMH